MSKKLLPNRISKVVPPNALPKVRQAAQLLYEVFGEPTQISDDDYKGLRKIADKLKRECDDVYAIAQENVGFVQQPMTIEEIEKDKLYYEFCDQVGVILKPVITLWEREQNVAGAEYFNSCTVFEGDVDSKVNRDANDVKARSVQVQLKAVDRNRGGNTANNTKKDNETPTK
jgi:hypothetical protein